MISSQFNIDSSKQSLWIFIIGARDLDRMKERDPIALQSLIRGGILKPPTYPDNLRLMIAYEDDEPELYRLIRAGDLVRLLEYLERGRKWVESGERKKNGVLRFQSKDVKV